MNILKTCLFVIANFFVLNLYAADPNIPAEAIFKNLKAPESYLENKGAKQKDNKSVWLIRESATLPGALVVTYYDSTSASPNGFVSRIYAQNRNSNHSWVAIPQSLAKNLANIRLEYELFVPVNADSIPANAQLSLLYPVLSREGFPLTGQLFPESSSYYYP